MNEKDLEERLRSVVDGSQPSAPTSLRDFLHEMPEAASPRRQERRGWLGGVARGLPRLFSPVPAIQRAELALVVSLALVVGLVGGGLLMSARHQPATAITPALASPTPTVGPTPRRSIVTAWAPYYLTLKTIPGFEWSGILSTQDGNDREALPVSAVEMKGGGYVGVSSDEFGQNGLVFSADGLYWNWDPPSDVAPSGVTLTSIATDGKGQLVLAGVAAGRDGTEDGRMYTSTDGHQWTAVANAIALFGGTAIQKVVHGLSGYVALGWNDNDPASRTVREWLSTDGVHWSAMSGVPIVGRGGFVLPMQSGYVLSGVPQEVGSQAPPIWFSSDGHTWLRASWKQDNGFVVGPIVSATVVSDGIVALAKGPDGSVNKLMQSSVDGTAWSVIAPTNAPALTSIGSLEGRGGRLLVATYEAKQGHVYVSTDDGLTWSIAGDLSTLANAPLGQTLIQLGADSPGQAAKVLCYGLPSSKMGVWLGSAEGS